MSDPDVIALGAGPLGLEVVPAIGKVVSLRCRRHGREWLAQPSGAVEATEDDQVYGAAEAWGWDELFPTVLPGASSPAQWPGSLRDHGELWGRPWQVTERSPTALGLAYADADLGFRFERRIELDDRRARCDYSLLSTREDAVPFQWSMHPILALRPGERLELEAASAEVTIPGHHLLPTAAAVVSWPEHNGLDLATVRQSDGETLLKLYVAPADGVVAVGGGECGLSVHTDLAFAPDVGIYVNYGGWPQGGPLHQVGIEPTNSAADDLAAALQSGRAGVLPAGERLCWSVEIRLGEGCAAPGGAPPQALTR